MDSLVTIRRYQLPDREALFRIAADTAFFGEPVEVFMDDRRVFLDAFYAYYPDYEPEHCWVACVDAVVVGFLTGCVNTERQREITAKVLEPAALRKVIKGEYRIGRKTWGYLLRYFLGRLRDEEPQVDVHRYPAHFHINLDRNCRGAGIGRRLILNYIDELKSIGVPGVHLLTTDYHQIACRLYHSLGFELIDSKKTRLWSGQIKEPVENRCYAMPLLR